MKELVNKLKEQKKTIAFAESITAGKLSGAIAETSGASNVLKGSVVTYQVPIKKLMLKVPEQILETYSAESIDTSIAMVLGLANLGWEADIYVAITGLADDPEGYPTKAEPGDIFVAILMDGKITERHTNIKADRNEVIRQAIDYTLNEVLLLLK